MLHTTMIALHAAAGVAAFVAGCFARVPPKAEQRARQLFGVYLVALGLMLVFLLAAIASHWRQLSTAEQVIFGGLFLLGLYMAWRALSAWGAAAAAQRPVAGALQGHIGFTLIALWDGLVIVSAIDLGAPGWLVGVLVVLGVVVGSRAQHRLEARAQLTG